MIQFYHFKKFLLVTILMGIVACSSKPVVHELPSTAAPSEEITTLEKDLNSAKNKQVDILSPKNFSEAQDSLEDAKKKFLNGKDTRQILHSIATENDYLKYDNSVADVARGKTQDIIAAREAALNANAQTYYKNDFKNADDDLKDATRDIEKNDMSTVEKKHAQLQKKYRDMEVGSIREKHLKESRDIITQTKKENAEKYAPRTLALAEKSYADTEAYIIANPQNAKEIQTRANSTKEAAYRAFNINRNAKGAAKVSPEELAVLIEKERERALENEKKANSMQDELVTAQSALERERETQSSLSNKSSEELEAERKKLEESTSLNEKYETARKDFTTDEAEVYRQGDNLLIRLKGMEFPSAKATIQTESYPLLSKVQKVIEDFGPSATITVEGHTDSVGGKKANNRLSIARAEAVKKYLEANGVGAEVKIGAIGYGDQKPIASNKTASGRAQNRRVDIIIKPESTNQ